MLEKRRHALPGVVTLEDLQEQVQLEVDPVDEGQVDALVDSPLSGPDGDPGAGRVGGSQRARPIQNLVVTHHLVR